MVPADEIKENGAGQEEPDSDGPSISEEYVIGKSGRKRRRIKIRKRIRIKKKPSAKKKVRKIAERIFWTLIILGFIASLIVMIVQLDIKDEKFKQRKSKPSPVKSY